MEVFRLSRQRFANDLSGKGAALKGARWNSIGFELIYSASNRSLAMAEIAVHFTMATLPVDYVMLTIDIPNDILIDNLSIADLPKNWNVFPHINDTQKIGDRFVLENKYCLLQVPSAVTKGDFNILINPNHIDFKRIKIIYSDNFPFDVRIFK